MSWDPQGIDHLYRHQVVSTGPSISRTYHVYTSPELFCEHVMRSCYYVLRHMSEGADSELVVGVSADAKSGIVSVSRRDEFVILFAFRAVIPPQTTAPVIRVHSICYDTTVFNILRDVNDRLQDIFEGHWRDAVPEASGAPATSMHRSLKRGGQGGRLPNELYDRVFEKMQQDGLTMNQAFDQYLGLLRKEEGTVIPPMDRSMVRDRFRKAMKSRLDKKDEQKGSLE